MSHQHIRYSMVRAWSEEDRREMQSLVHHLREVLPRQQQSLRDALTRSTTMAVICERLVGRLEWLLERLVADPDADGRPPTHDKDGWPLDQDGWPLPRELSR